MDDNGFSNVSAAILCQPKSQEKIQSLTLLFEIAFRFAEKGFIPYILTKSELIHELRVHLVKYHSHPILLERIYFRYFLTPENIIYWCQDIQSVSIKPDVVLLNIDDFCSSEDFESSSICSAIMDAAVYISKHSKNKHIYVFITVFLDFDFVSSALIYPRLLSFFPIVWFVEKYDATMLLKQYKKADNVLPFMKNGDLICDLSNVFLTFQL